MTPYWNTKLNSSMHSDKNGPLITGAVSLAAGGPWQSMVGSSLIGCCAGQRCQESENFRKQTARFSLGAQNTLHLTRNIALNMKMKKRQSCKGPKWAQRQKRNLETKGQKLPSVWKLARTTSTSWNLFWKWKKMSAKSNGTGLKRPPGSPTKEYQLLFGRLILFLSFVRN